VIRRLRVAQWATGNIGTRALRELVRHPDLELVGLYVYDPRKAGVDAGEICGEPATGVAATNDRQALIDLSADCVVYMPRAADLDDVVAMLERGTNIVTTCGEFAAGARPLGDADRERVADACRRGSSSIFATGSSPGFITDALPFALLSLQRRVDSIEIEEYANLSRRDSPELLFDLMGFGCPPGPVDDVRAAYLLTQFGPPLDLLTEAAGRPVDDWSARGEVAVAREPLQISAGDIAAGTVAAQRTVMTGRSGGSEVVRFTATWYCGTDLDPAWDVLPTGWRVRMKGDAPLNVTLEFPMPVDELGEATPSYTANRPVNAIPYVCAASPGILTPTDLPPLTPDGP
jgi:4-hydroxy-tetrahydrodipicolinate reductase